MKRINNDNTLVTSRHHIPIPYLHQDPRHLGFLMIEGFISGQLFCVKAWTIRVSLLYFHSLLIKTSLGQSQGGDLSRSPVFHSACKPHTGWRPSVSNQESAVQLVTRPLNFPFPAWRCVTLRSHDGHVAPRHVTRWSRGPWRHNGVDRCRIKDIDVTKIVRPMAYDNERYLHKIQWHLDIICSTLGTLRMGLFLLHLT